MRIVLGARERVAPGGTLVVGHGYDQAEAVRALFAAAGFAEIVTARDLAVVPRVFAGRLAAEERPPDALASTASGSLFG